MTLADPGTTTPNTKWTEPLGEATKNRDVIDTWAESHPEHNPLAVIPDGVLVIEVDTGTNGPAALKERVGDLPATFETWVGNTILYWLRLPDGWHAGKGSKTWMSDVTVHGRGALLPGPGSMLDGVGPVEVPDTEIDLAPAPWELLLALNDSGLARPSSPNLAEALRYVRRGWKVVPLFWIEEGRCACSKGERCPAPGKHPLFEMGEDLANASSDVRDVLDLWGRKPRANVGIAAGRSDLVIIDLDLRGDTDGEEELLAHLAVHGIELPPTLNATTGSGGKHLVYRQTGDRLRGKNGWLPGVDVKADGGYFVAPPSNHVSGGTYTWENDGAAVPVALPEEIAALIRSAPGRAGTGGNGGGGVDGDAYRRAKESGHVPVGTRDGFFFLRARELRLGGLDWDEALADLREWWQERTEQPAGDEFPWSAVEAKLRRAWDDVEPNPPWPAGTGASAEEPSDGDDEADGAAGASSEQDDDGDGDGDGEPDPAFLREVAQQWRRLRVLDRANELRAQERLGDAGGPWELVPGSELLDRPDPPWTIRGLVQDVGVGQVFGPYSVGKTLLTLDMSLTVANGLPDWHGYPVERPGPVVYALMEGGFDFGKRLRAWPAAHPGRTADDLLVVMEPFLDAGARASMDRLAGSVRDANVEPRLVVIDTQGKATPGRDENSATELNAVFGLCHRLARDLGCFVLLVHHTGHDETRARGASAQGQAADLLLGITGIGGIGSGLSQVKVEKLRAGRPGDVRYFRMEEVAGSVWAMPLSPQDAGAAAMAEQSQKMAELERRIIEVVAEEPGISINRAYDRLGGNKATVTGAIRALCREGGPLRNEETDRRSRLFVTEETPWSGRTT